MLGFLSTSSGIGLLVSAEWEGLLLVGAVGGNIWFVILNTSLWHHNILWFIQTINFQAMGCRRQFNVQYLNIVAYAILYGSNKP